MTGWRVYWVPQDKVRTGVRTRVLAGWKDLSAREDAVGVRAGDPIFLAPDYGVDAVLARWTTPGLLEAVSSVKDDRRGSSEQVPG